MYRSVGGPWLAAQRATLFSCLRARWALQKRRRAERAEVRVRVSGEGEVGSEEGEGEGEGVAESAQERGLTSIWDGKGVRLAWAEMRCRR